MKIAVIVLNYNSASDTKKCISYLIKQGGVELNIIVVDNCSSTEERSKLELVLSEYKDACAPHIITYIPNDENHGYNAGNNIGLRYASQQGYKYALISNPDMEYPDVTYVQKMVSVMEENSEIVVQATDIVNNDGQHQNPMRELTFSEEFWWPIEYIRHKVKGTWYSLDYKKNQKCDKVWGCCLLLSLSFISRIGYFDEGVFLYSEESILGRQVKMHGKIMYYNSDLSSIHRHIEQAKGEKKGRMRALLKSRIYFIKYYANYNCIQKKLAIMSKRLQYAFWHYN